MQTVVASALAVFAVVLVLAANGAAATATEESELSCSPTLVEPNQAITCYIYVRDFLQEPTTQFSPNDFAVRTVSEESAAVITISAIAISGDPTVATFTVKTSTGTNLRIDVVLASTGVFVRNTGVVASVLTWPAKRLGAITCDKAALTLRSSTICSAGVFGDDNTAAVVHADDIFFSEDHSAGSFAFLTGSRTLTFNYTAPTSLLTAMSTFTIRATLAGSATVYSVSLPMRFPVLPATRRSVLRCTAAGSNGQPCFVNAADDLGPVTFDPAQYTVQFERIIGDAWLDCTANVSTGFAPTASAAAQQLVFAPVIDNLVYTARLHVLTAGPSPVEVLGSPVLFRMGSPPQWQQMLLRGCTATFVTERNVTVCTIDVGAGVSADPAYVALGAMLTGSTLSAPVSVYDAATKTTTIVFTYTAPSAIGSRRDEFLSVTVGGTNIPGSPYRLVVFPRDVVVVAVDGQAGQRPYIIAVGLVFFGAILVTGMIVMFRLHSHKNRLHQFRQAQAMRHAKTAGPTAGHDAAPHITTAPSTTEPTTPAPTTPVPAAGADAAHAATAAPLREVELQQVGTPTDILPVATLTRRFDSVDSMQAPLP